MSEIEKAIRQICEEKNIPYESVIGTIEAALAAAYRKDFGEKNQNIKVEFDAETGGSRVYDEKTVVADELYDAAVHLLEEREKARAEGTLEKKELTPEEKEKEKELSLYPKLHIPISEAKKISRKAGSASGGKKGVEAGEILRIELEVPTEYGRMAAQTAKQVIIQRLRETEREMVFNELKDQQGKIVIATVQRKDGRIVLLDVGKATAVMFPDDQIRTEFYRPGARIKVYVKSVGLTPKGPEILVSRTHADVVAKLFESEIPEIASGVVEIKAIAREAGSRSKVAVYTADENIDPIGSCIGQRGARIQTVIGELGGEKIDVISYDAEPAKFIGNSLSPAKVLRLDINEADKGAVAHVVPDQFSLAIGRGGQNVRLAAKLTGWNIKVVEERHDDVKPASASAPSSPEASEGHGEAMADKEVSVTPEEAPSVAPPSPKASEGRGEAMKGEGAAESVPAETVAPTEASVDKKEEAPAEKPKKRGRKKKAAEAAE